MILYFHRASQKLNVDSSQPTTSIQIRLADGSRLSGRFNLSHTVNDIRTFVVKYVIFTEFFATFCISLFLFQTAIFFFILQCTATICGTVICFVDNIPEQRAHRFRANDWKSWSCKRRYHATSQITALPHEYVQFSLFFFFKYSINLFFGEQFKIFSMRCRVLIDIHIYHPKCVREEQH